MRVVLTCRCPSTMRATSQPKRTYLVDLADNLLAAYQRLGGRATAIGGFNLVWLSFYFFH
jgi:hypothetical protein